MTASGAVSLRPKVFGLLAYLIEHRDRVVSKEELFERLWPDVHVGDATLNSCVKSARQAVGDSGRAQRVIRTWHGHGYRFVAAIEEESDDARPAEGAAGEETGRIAAESDGTEPAPPLEATPPQDLAPAPPGIGPAIDAFPSGKEHKQVTVLHCALADAARLARRLGPEAMDDAMERFMATAQGTVQRYGGTVTQWLGDGCVALFGAPRALDDHARRAVSASLDLLDSLTDGGEDLAVRIGLHTGPVVVGTMERDPERIFTAAGTTTDRANALQENARPGTIMASEATLHLVESEVEFERLDDGEAASFRICAFITRQSGVPRRAGGLSSRFLGRDRELDLLHDALEGAREGSGQVVSISGEPGIGKSRLVEEFAGGLAESGVDLYRVNCLSYAGNSPYLPVRRLLRQLCDITSGAPEDQALAKLDRRLAAVGLTTPVSRSLLGQVLGLTTDTADLEHLSPLARRTRTFDELYTILGSACAQRPCLIVVEDLHWIDATSEAWISGLVMRLAGLRVLLLVTYRQGYQAPWLPQSTATQLALSGLKADAATALVREIPTAAALSEAELRRIVSRAQGNPFFLEELTWSLGDGGAGQRGIPETVQTVLAQRIDRLEPADKRLLQIAAVIGPEVSEPLLAAVDGLAEAARRDGLLRLQEAELLYPRQAGSERFFTFKHALTQDVAYTSLVARTRAAIHGRIAAALEAGFQAQIRLRPELLAHHLTEAGDLGRATGYWLQAGRGAAERSASEEAIAQLTKGLELISTLPDGGDRDERGIAFQLTLGVALQNAKGPGSPEAERIYRRASDLCRATGDKRSLFFATYGLWRFCSAAFDLPASRALAEELLDLGRDSGDRKLELQARHAHWTTIYNCGELESAQAHIERGLALWDPSTEGHHAFMVAGHEPRFCAYLTISKILWHQGYPDQAVDACTHARSLAEELAHPPCLAIALNHTLRLAVFRRHVGDVRRWQAALRALAAEHGLTGHTAWCDLVQLWLDAQETGSADRIPEVYGTLATHPERAGAERPWVLMVLADACRLAGRAADGLTIVRAAPAESTPLWASEFRRLKGELLLCGPEDRASEAEALFQEAIASARLQSARSLELRGATSLARLWHRQGRAAEARDLLAPLTAWFDEGLDLPDLVEAKALLDG